MAFATYYQSLLAQTKAEVQISFIDASKGRGLFASRNYNVGDVLFSEGPLCAIQEVPNRVEAFTCSHCFRFLGSLEQQLQHHQTLLKQEIQGYKPKRVSALPLAAQSTAFFQTELVPCHAGCGETYCSENCRASAFTAYHRLLCVGMINDQNHPLVLFKMHAIEHNELFLLVLKIMASLIITWETNGHDLDSALLPFAVYHKKPWWEVRCVSPSPGAHVHEHAEGTEADHEHEEEEEEMTPDKLISLSSESLQLLQATFAPYLLNSSFSAVTNDSVPSPLLASFFNTSSSPFSSVSDPHTLLRNLPANLQNSVHTFLTSSNHPLRLLFSHEFYANLLGMLELNNHSVEIVSPLHKYWKAIDTFPGAQKAAAKQILDPIVSIIRQLKGEEEDEEEETAAMDTETTGKQEEEEDEQGSQEIDDDPSFPSFQGLGIFRLGAFTNHSYVPNCEVKFTNDQVAFTIVQKPIQAGEEITTCYVDDMDTYEERQRVLREYGFVCTCPKCTVEAAGGVWQAS